MTIENHPHNIEEVTSWAKATLSNDAAAQLGLENSRYDAQKWKKVAKCTKGRCDGVLLVNGDIAMMRKVVEKNPGVIKIEKALGLLEGQWGILADFEPLKDTKEYLF